MDTWTKSLNDIIAFNNSDGFMATRIQDILYCKGEGSYTHIFVREQGPFMVSKNLKIIEGLLPEVLFIRVHKKYLVNKLHIRRYLVNGKNALLISNGEHVKVSFLKKKLVLKCFNGI